MSQEVRDALVASKYTIFQRQSQRDDLRDPNKTHTGLIGLLTYLVSKEHYILFTAVRSDHHDDSSLGRFTHANGFSVDCWANGSESASDYLDANDPKFQEFLHDISEAPYLYQVGLGGSAQTQDNYRASGATVFSDNGSDHVHIGSNS